MQVGTLYDTKEEIFRNYPGFVGPRSTGLTLQYCWEEGTDGRVTFTWTNPSGKAVSSLEKHIGTKTSCGVHTLETNDLSILPTGVWSIVVHSDSGEIAELQFLVLPIEHDGGSDDGKQVDEKLLISRIDELTSQFWKMEGLCSQNDLVLECPEIKVCTDEEWSSMSLDPKSDMGETFL